MREVDIAYANLPNEHCTILQDHASLSATTWQCTNEMRWLDKEVIRTLVDAPGTIGIDNLGYCTSGTQYTTIETKLQQKMYK